MRFLYSVLISLSGLLIRLASLFNKKANLWVAGRKNWQTGLQHVLKENKKQVFWFHCASLGEFEQGRPVIERLKREHTGLYILLTFFSPSGYEVRKNYAYADYVCYLPLDTIKNAKQFIALVKPSAVFFVKYEFWFNYLITLKKQAVPTYLISGIFREKHYFFKSYSSWFRKQLKAFNHFFVQDEISLQLLKSIGFNNVTVAGDTRFDRVVEVVQQVKPIPLIEKFKQHASLLIAGSTWQSDEALLASYDFTKENFKLIIAPHEISEQHIQYLMKKFTKNTLRYSQATDQTVLKADVLIIDNVGMLLSVYQYGKIAYIGGGFGKGIHNILEAAAFGLPVIFGPNYKKFEEAKALIRLKAAFSISNREEFKEIMKQLIHSQAGIDAPITAKSYTQQQTGATSIILQALHFSKSV